MMTSVAKNASNLRINWRVNDFCEAHGIGRTTFYEAVKRGEINVIKYGNRTLIPDAEARRWQDNNVSNTH